MDSEEGVRARKDIARLAEEHGRHLAFGTLYELGPGKRRAAPGCAVPSWEDFECLQQRVRLRVDGESQGKS